jgi:MFS family permease
MEDAEARIGGEDILAPTSIRKVALASFIGSTVEWYDFFVYGTAAALVFALSYATEQLGIPSSTMLTAILVTAAIGFITKPIYGALSDRIGRRPIYAAGSIIGALVAFPFYLALESRSVILIFLAYLVAINIAHNLNDSVESSFFSELFGSRVRYSGAGPSTRGSSHRLHPAYRRGTGRGGRLDLRRGLRCAGLPRVRRLRLPGPGDVPA